MVDDSRRALEVLAEQEMQGGQLTVGDGTRGLDLVPDCTCYGGAGHSPRVLDFMAAATAAKRKFEVDEEVMRGV